MGDAPVLHCQDRTSSIVSVKHSVHMATGNRCRATLLPENVATLSAVAIPLYKDRQRWQRTWKGRDLKATIESDEIPAKQPKNPPLLSLPFFNRCHRCQ